MTDRINENPHIWRRYFAQKKQTNMQTNMIDYFAKMKMSITSMTQDNVVKTAWRKTVSRK